MVCLSFKQSYINIPSLPKAFGESWTGKKSYSGFKLNCFLKIIEKSISQIQRFVFLSKITMNLNRKQKER